MSSVETDSDNYSYPQVDLGELLELSRTIHRSYGTAGCSKDELEYRVRASLNEKGIFFDSEDLELATGIVALSEIQVPTFTKSINLIPTFLAIRWRVILFLAVLFVLGSLATFFTLEMVSNANIR